MPLKVFYCYAHKDKMRRSFLEKHLSTLQRQDLITGWHDEDINAGKEREKEIDTNMDTADIILLLVSPDFIHSDYCYGVGMKHALERHKNGTARVVPIILRPGDYKGTPFSELQPLPTDAIPITDRKWHNHDEAYSNVAQGIRAVVEELVSNQWLSEGNIHFFRQQYYEALEAFERAIYFNPNNAHAYVGKGQALNMLIPYPSFKYANSLS
jgi:tetratricopeptide (TPR) repeat protein